MDLIWKRGRIDSAEESSVVGQQDLSVALKRGSVDMLIIEVCARVAAIHDEVVDTTTFERSP